MMDLDRFPIFYDILAYLVAARSLINEILYKLGFKRKLDVRRDLPADLTGRVAIVTGGTRGLGLTVVRALISKGCNVLVASSQEDNKFAQIIDRIYEGIPDKDEETSVKRGTVTLHHLELSDMDSVRRFIDAYKKTKQNLNFLICNAGIMFAPRKTTEVGGFESHLAVNYLGHCLLMVELFPLLKKSADDCKEKSRVISVASSTHEITRFKFDDLYLQRNYSSSQAYAQSKLAQIMFSAKYSRKIRDKFDCNNVQSFSLHPGVVLSDLYEHVHLIKYFPFLIPLIKLVTRDVIQGAETILYATLSNELKNVSGLYLEDNAIKEPSRTAQSLSDQNSLWKLTFEILKPWLNTKLRFEGNMYTHYNDWN